MPQRITLLVDDMLGGGAARVASYLSHAWVEMGRQVTLLTNDDGRQSPHYAVHPAVIHRPLALRAASSNLLVAVGRNLRRIWKLRRAIVESSPDVLISFLDGNNVLCLLATRGLPYFPVVISERTDPFGRNIGFAWERLRRMTYPWADCLVTQSSHALSYFAPRVQVKGAVIPNPVVPPSLTGLSAVMGRTHRKIVVTLGSLRPVKGHDLLIDAFARIATEFLDWDLVIHGDGPARQTLIRCIDEHGLGGRVFLPGQTADPIARLREADLFVLSSRAEGFPNALAEAMACGLPVVSFACDSGPAELIRQGVDGLLVSPGDVAELAGALAHLMSDPRERSRLATRAPEVVERFSMARVLALWEATLEKVTAPSKN